MILHYFRTFKTKIVSNLRELFKVTGDLATSIGESYSGKCANCGSKNHSHSNCPQRRISKGSEEGGGSSTDESEPSGSFLGGVLGVFLGIAIIGALCSMLFPLPFKLVNSNFSVVESSSWTSISDIWIFSATFWIILFQLNYFLFNSIIGPEGSEEKWFYRTCIPYILIPFFGLCLSNIFTIVYDCNYIDNFYLLTIATDFIILIVFYFYFKSLGEKKSLKMQYILTFLMFLPFLYVKYFPNRTQLKNEIRLENSNFIRHINSNAGANMRAKPTVKSQVLITIPNNSEVEFLNDSNLSENINWYRIKFKDKEGWVSKSLLTR